MSVEHYPDIADHGLIGDLQTAALVTTDGTVDWFCCPRFDSPTVFAALLDSARGGHFRVAPGQGGWESRQLYFPGSAILITRFLTPDGVGEVHDFMPVTTDEVTGRHRLVRVLRATRGTVHFVMDLQPRFDYGRGKHVIEVCDQGAVFRSDDLDLTLHVAGEAAIARRGDGVHGAWTLREGEAGGVLLESAGAQPRRLTMTELTDLERETARFWGSWLSRSAYSGRWREMVGRSAITLKLLTYLPSGAPVAAPTMGLPEQTGGERNWDYRYTWIRDGSLSIHALLGLGYAEEAEAFAVWLRNRATEQGEWERHGGSGPLRIMYRVDGTSDLDEEPLDHLDGWRGSRPVRAGNGAVGQLQLDVYGELMEAVALGDAHGLSIGHAGWLAITGMIDWLCEHWDQPEEGIWETRGGRQNFTYGRFQCWVALDRAIRLARQHGRPARVSRWEQQRDLIYDQIMNAGWNAGLRAFTQRYGTGVLDSSLLLMPLRGFVAPRDPRWLSTLAAMDRTLVSDSLVYRYDPAVSPDGLPGDEGTFTLCTFWYVEALARAGRLDEAVLTFEKMQTYANHLGLYSEEIGLTGEQLGNFPQAFSHLALINAAVSLDRQLDHAGLGQGPC
jgi:GH15 family glucan-1,4-alpha-glucosidase